MPCSFVGPSSLYQRWNLQIRQLYGLYPLKKVEESEEIRILVIKRTLGKGSGGLMYTSRVFTNLEEIVSRLKQRFSSGISVIVEDLATLSFEEQIRLIHSVSLIIGVHGAGVPTSMHMSLGRPNCCGVVEIFPRGEFSPIRGYGNMARRLGLHYQRLDVGGEDSYSHGVRVPVEELLKITNELVEEMKKKPSCVLASVINDPYFDSVAVPKNILDVN
jgi:translation initiation factor 1 (eIF-1/SUI1)